MPTQFGWTLENGGGAQSDGEGEDGEGARAEVNGRGPWEEREGEEDASWEREKMTVKRKRVGSASISADEWKQLDR